MQTNDNQIHLLADVIPPAPASPYYTYLADGFENYLQPGLAVRIPLGTRMVCGIVLRVYEAPLSSGIEYKSIHEILYEQAVLNERHLDLWQWVSEYYLTSLGSVMVNAMPAELLSGLYRDKTEVYVRLSEMAAVGKTEIYGKLRSIKQKECFDFLFSLYPNGIRKSDIPKEYSAVSLNKLISDGVVESLKQTVKRDNGVKAIEDLKILSKAQMKAYSEIKTGFEHGKTVLLHGVPASGKTEIYKRLISECLDDGGQVLYLVPEILLTSQLTLRLGKVFGDRLAVVHSLIPMSRKAEAFKRAKSGEPMVLIGARSAVFAPFENLRLIIIDEEHDDSYKQEEHQPLYNARSVALVLAKLTGADVLLGTATPSAESYYNCEIGKYCKVVLDEPYHEVARPDIKVIDMVQEKRKRKFRDEFSFDLLNSIKRTVDAGRQVILFHGRRGFNTFTVCDNCGWVPKCPHCGVSLVYHDKLQKLKCHYCGYLCALPESCPECGGVPRRSGIGTEKVQKDLQALFPELRILRLDTDACKSMGAYREILDDFDSGKADVLVGTQMLVKGLDFANVGMVGIVNADMLLNFPDFRSVERAYQTFLQVAGRGGRKDYAAEVLIQSSKADHPVFEMLRRYDGDLLYSFVLDERKLFRYPPFYRVINIELRHKDAVSLRKMENDAYSLLASYFGEALSEPFTPFPSRKNMFYLSHLMLKVDVKLSYRQVNDRLIQCARHIGKKYGISRAAVVFDVDPV